MTKYIHQPNAIYDLYLDVRVLGSAGEPRATKGWGNPGQVAQPVEALSPNTQRLQVSSLSEHMPRSRLSVQSRAGHIQEATNRCFSLIRSLSLSLKSINISTYPPVRIFFKRLRKSGKNTYYTVDDIELFLRDAYGIMIIEKNVFILKTYTLNYLGTKCHDM